MSSAPYVDLWVCQGRMCRSLGSDELLSQIHRGLADRPGDAARVRVLRGGCYGVCDGAPNLVVRRWAEREARPDAAVDRLILTEQDNERVYGQVGGEQVPVILRSHLEDALGLEEYPSSRVQPGPPAVSSAALPAPRGVAERIGALRRARRAGAASGDTEP